MGNFAQEVGFRAIPFRLLACRDVAVGSTATKSVVRTLPDLRSCVDAAAVTVPLLSIVAI